MPVQPNYCDDIKFHNLNDLQISTSHSVYETLQPENNLKRVMTEYWTYDWSDYEYDIVHAALPWIAFGVLAFITLIVAIVFRFLRCMCCKKQIKARGRCIKLTCVTSAFIVTFLSLLTCSLIIYYSDQTFQSIQQVQCAAGKFPYMLKHGDMSKGWGGMDLLHESTSNITHVLKTTYNNSTLDLWHESDWLSDSTITSPLNDYYSKYKNSKVKSPYPFSSSTIATNYTSNLGPISEKKTWTGLIYSEYKAKLSKVIQELVNIKTITLFIQQNLDQTISFSSDVDSEVDGYRNGTDEVHENIDNWIVDYMPQIVESWRGFTFWVVVWGWFICIGVLITVYSQAMGKHYLAHGLCCFWLFSGLVAIIGFLASAGTLAVGLVTRDSCEVIDDLFTKDGIGKYDLIIPLELVPLARECIIDDGNLIPVLNLTSFLAGFQDINDSYSDLNTLGISQKLADFESVQMNLKQLASPVNYFKVHNESVFQVDTAGYNLNELNKFTNNNTLNNFQEKCEEEFSDLWVFYLKDCLVGYDHVTPDDDFGIGPKSCLVLSEWPLGQVNQRYKDLNCTQVTTFGDYETNIFQYVQGLQNFVNSVDDLFKKMTNDLVKFNTTLNGFVEDVVDVYQRLGNYLSSPEMILFLMESTIGKEGLKNSLQCGLIKDYKSEIKISMCDNSLENAYQVFVFVFLLSFLMLLMELLNLYLSRVLLKALEIY